MNQEPFKALSRAAAELQYERNRQHADALNDCASLLIRGLENDKVLILSVSMIDRGVLTSSTVRMSPKSPVHSALNKEIAKEISQTLLGFGYGLHAQNEELAFKWPLLSRISARRGNDRQRANWTIWPGRGLFGAIRRFLAGFRRNSYL